MKRVSRVQDAGLDNRYFWPSDVFELPQRRCHIVSVGSRLCMVTFLTPTTRPCMTEDPRCMLGAGEAGLPERSDEALCVCVCCPPSASFRQVS
jgi:hypothetical protein